MVSLFDARMVVIAAHHAVDTVHARALPLRLAARHRSLGGFEAGRDGVHLELMPGLSR